MDFQSLEPAGGTMGSGGYVVYDDSVCIVDMSRYFNRFNRYQSCGKCFPCRIGTKSLLEMTDRIAFGGGRPDDIDVMGRWSEHVVEMSLCGLGQTAPLPLMGGIRWFRDEFVEHISRQVLPHRHLRQADRDPGAQEGRPGRRPLRAAVPAGARGRRALRAGQPGQPRLRRAPRAPATAAWLHGNGADTARLWSPPEALTRGARRACTSAQGERVV